MNVEALISLAGYFVLMLGIGLYAFRESTDDSSGYQRLGVHGFLFEEPFVFESGLFQCDALVNP